MPRGKGKMAFYFVDSFDAVELTAPDKRNYTQFRRKVLRAGRFSCFEASANPQVAALYTQLCRDPEVITDNETRGYPWTLVRWANSQPNAKLLVRCMGGQFCNHRPGTCTATASGIEARSDETAQQAQPEARARPDAQTPPQSPSYSKYRGSVE